MMGQATMPDYDSRMRAFKRRLSAFHEAGHAAIIYWRSEALHGRRIVLHERGGSFDCPVFGSNESNLMVLLGGPMAGALAIGESPDKAIRGQGVYRDPGSDAYRIRKLVRELRGGKDDRKYQIEIQDHCRTVIQEPHIWQGITKVAERLIADGEITGEEADQIFESCHAPQLYSGDELAWQGFKPNLYPPGCEGTNALPASSRTVTRPKSRTARPPTKRQRMAQKRRTIKALDLIHGLSKPLAEQDIKIWTPKELRGGASIADKSAKLLRLFAARCGHRRGK